MKCVSIKSFEAVQYTGDNSEEVAKVTGREVWTSNSKKNLAAIFDPPFGNKFITPKDWAVICEDGVLCICSPDDFEKWYKEA